MKPKKVNQQDFGLAVCFRIVQVFRSVCKERKRFEYNFSICSHFEELLKLQKVSSFSNTFYLEIYMESDTMDIVND